MTQTVLVKNPSDDQKCPCGHDFDTRILCLIERKESSVCPGGMAHVGRGEKERDQGELALMLAGNNLGTSGMEAGLKGREKGTNTKVLLD